jgi:type IV secretory pathway TraG/TraD family ATPase VirD4
MMAQAILSLPNLPARLEAASKDKLKIWTTRPLSQLISVKDSEKTVASIIGTAQRIFQRFLKKDFVGAFCGKTTLPLDLDGKQLIVFGLDRNNRDIVSPLLAAILHMIVTRNVSRTLPRKDPLVVALDELPTLYLPALVNWLNESREDGFVGILGYQNIAQLEKVYGKELTRAIWEVLPPSLFSTRKTRNLRSCSVTTWARWKLSLIPIAQYGERGCFPQHQRTISKAPFV